MFVYDEADEMTQNVDADRQTWWCDVVGHFCE